MKMLKLATILDNPGEPEAETQYRDPRELQRLGYNGVVLFETTALSGVAAVEDIDRGEVRRWIEHHFEVVEHRIRDAVAAGLGVYLVYDVLSLPKEVVKAHLDEIGCRNRPATLCPASDVAIHRSVDALRSLLDRLPDVDGIVLRFGDNDAARLPHLTGNDIYQPHCPRCSQLGRMDRILSVVEPFYRLVVEQMSKRLIMRAWNVRPNGLHDSLDLCRRVRERLPGDPKHDGLIMSFKFTQTDFWRYQRWNQASLVFGDRPIIYELECQREFEGKGTIPNWQVPLWRDGPGEVVDEQIGLARVGEQVNLAGLWAWVRGGGWGGPFVENESWIDANAFAVPRLADRPDLDPRGLADDWIRERLDIHDAEVVSVLRTILEHSPQTVLQAFYIGPFAQSRPDPWHPNADWIQDDLIDAQALWRMIGRVPEGQLDQIVTEKREAVERIAGDHVVLHRHVTAANRLKLEPLVQSLVYAESLLRVLYHLTAGLVAYRQLERTHDQTARARCRRHLVDAQAHWNHHTQRHSSLSGVGTAFRATQLWPMTQRLLSEVG